MTTYIQTVPTGGVSVLHVEGCRKIHHKVTLASMESFTGPWDRVCDVCISDPVLAESDANNAREFWKAAQFAEADRRKAEIDEMMLRDQADRYEIMHGWLPIRDWLAARFDTASVRLYRDASTNWGYAPIFEFYSNWPVKTAGADVRLTFTDGRWTIGRVSNTYVASSADARLLAEALLMLEAPEAVLKGAAR
jgi:hypothetical protein